MIRRQFSREFKLEAVWLVKERGVSGMQASWDLDVGEGILRRWIKELTADPGQAFPGQGQLKPVWRRGKPGVLLHHSDQGSQYSREQFQKLLADHGIICSMSRSGNVWDNAAMESFFSSLKTERTARKVYRTRDQARADVFDYIERFSNPRRRHSTIGYLSPMEFERIKTSA